MAEVEEILNVQLKINSQAAAEAARTLEKHQEQVQKLGTTYKENEAALRKFFGASAGYTQVNQALSQVNETARQSVEDFIAANRSTAEWSDSMDKLTIRAEGLKRTGSALSQLGFRELGGLIERAGDVIRITQDVGKVADILPTLGAAASAAAADLLPMIAAIAPIAAIAGAAALALKVLTDTIAQQKKMVDDTVAALKADTDNRLSNIDAIHNSTAAQLKAQIETDQAKLAEIQVEKAARQAFLADIQKQYADLGSTFDPATRAALGEAGQTAQQSIDDLTKREQELTTAIDANTKQILPAVEAREKETASIQASKTALEDQIKAEQKLTEQRKKEQDELQKVLTQEAALTENRVKTYQQRQQDDYRAGAEADLQRQIDAARAIEAEQARADKIAQIRETAAQVDIAAQQKTAAAILQARQAEMDNELKLFHQYVQSEQRATEDYNRERVRKLEDLYTSLSDIAASRDVAAFVTTRARGLTDISRGDEDFGVAAQRRRQDYEQQRAEMERALQQRIQDLQTAAATERQQRQQQLQDRIQQEQAAGQQQVKQSEVLQKQLADLRAQWARQDLAARRRAEDDAFNQQMSALQAHQQSLTIQIGQTTTPLITFFGQVTQAVSGMINQIRAIATAPAPASSLASTGGGSLRATAYAAGIDSVPYDLLAYLHKGERVTRGVDAASAQSNVRPIIIQPGGALVHVAGVGDLVSTAALHEQTNELVRAVKIAIQGT